MALMEQLMALRKQLLNAELQWPACLVTALCLVVAHLCWRAYNNAGRRKAKGKEPALAVAAEAIRLLKTAEPKDKGKYLIDESMWPHLPPWVFMDRQPYGALPSLSEDPLFRDNDDPSLLPWLPRAPRLPSRGAALIVPGGNYETLSPGEAEPVAQWVVSSLSIPAYVLKYRLLPTHNLDDMLQDFRNGLREVRRLSSGGPVVTFCFSAGAHLSAAACAAEVSERDRPDAQVFAYPSLDAEEWLDVRTAGFFRSDVASEQVRSLVQGPGRLEKMLKPGPAFVCPPPTFMVASTLDGVCHAENHGDLYCQAARRAGGEMVYMRAPFGYHGFGLMDIWTRPCVRWLQDLGFGAYKVP